MFEIEKFRPTSHRRRVLIVLLTLAMVVLLIWSVTRKSGVVRGAMQHPADLPACTPGQTADCVGSKMDVIALPPAAAASR